MMIIDPGLQLECDPNVGWYLVVKGTTYLLREVADFSKVWLLLERPYHDAKSDLDNVTMSNALNIPFSMWEVVATALVRGSNNTIDKAMVWVQQLPFEEKILLVPFLVKV